MKIALIIHNVRSCHNVGSMLRTADGLGAEVYFTGYSPYPLSKNDRRLPHEARRISSQIAKTALGAEQTAIWHQRADIYELIKDLRKNGYEIAALEQTKNAISLAKFAPSHKVAVIVGREVEGLEPKVIKSADKTVEIPMSGQKESFNVAVAAAIALYHLKFALSPKNQ